MKNLQAVFWDYPQWTDARALSLRVETLRREGNAREHRWFLVRFLEHARVRDALQYFRIEEIEELLPTLRLRPATRKKWERLVEIYGARSARR